MPKAKTVSQVIAGEAVVGTPQQRFDDMLGIASVIHNRSLQTRVTPEQVVSVQKQFNAYGKALPDGASAYVDMADRAMRQVQETGPVHNATFYATPEATRNLPKGLQAIAETTGHRYFSDPKARAIETAVGFRQPTALRASLPANGPVPTAAPRGLLSTPQPVGGLLSDPEDDAFRMTAKPVMGPLNVKSGFGMRDHPLLGRQKLHTGMDFARTSKKAIDGKPAISTAAGTVVSAGKRGGYGNRVEVDHGKGVVTSYSHLGSIGVKVGDAVRSGQEVGKIGSTGQSTGPHLHFEMSVNGKKVDPAKYVKEATPPSVAVQSVPRSAVVPTTTSARVPSTAKPAVGGLLDDVASARPVGLLGPTTARPVPSNPKPANANTAAAPATVASIAKSTTVPSAARALSPVDNKPTPIKGVDITGGLADRGPRVTSVSTTPQAQPLSQAQSMNLAGRLDLSTPKPAAPLQAAMKSAQVAQSPASALARAVSTPVSVSGGLLSANVPATGLMSAAVKTTPTALSPVSNNPAKVATRDVTAERFDYGPQLPAMSYGPQMPNPERARVAPQAVAAPSLPALPAPKTIPARQVANVAPVDEDRFGPQKAPVTRTVAPEVVSRVMSPTMAARVAEKAPAAPRSVVSAPSFSGPGLPSVPSAPTQSKVGQLGARIGMNKGALAGSLLGSAVGGPVGGLLGGMIGRSMVEGNPSRQAKAAMREGWDSFSGMSSQAAAAANGVPTGGLLSRASNAIGGLFSGGFGGSTSGPIGPSMSSGSSTSAGGIGPGGSGPRDPSGNRGFAGSSFGGDKSASASNNNTSKSSGSSKSSGGKKK